MRAMLDAGRRHPLVRTRAMRQLTMANGLVGLASSITLPFVPLFLTRSVGASATEIGLLLTLSGASGVLVSSLFGSLSGRLPSRRPLIAAGCVAAAAGDVVYALSDSYPVVLAASLTLLSGAWLAVPQLYARGRELLDAEGAAPAPTLTALRSVVSLAWIVGPPLTGLLLTVSGFPQAFLLVAALMLAASVLVVADGDPADAGRAVRRVGRPALSWSRLLSRAARSPLPGLSGGVALSAGAVVVLQTANAMSVTTMPLLLTTDLRGDPRDVGLVFGLSAALEIPIMLGLGWAAARFGSLRVMLLSLLFGVLYFGSVAVATAIWQIAVAQLLSAVYVAGLFGVGIAYFQELLDEPGNASTLYFNGLTAGSTVAGVLWGLIVAAGGYRGSYAACVVMAGASVVLLGAGHRLRRRPGAA